MNTVNECVEALEREMRLRRYCHSSIKTYGSCIRMFMRRFRKHPEAITIEEIKDYLLSIRSTAYHKQMNGAIHRFYEFVMKKRISLMDLPYPRSERRVPEILSPEEFYRVISCIRNLKHQAIIQLIYSCALRIGEVINIKISHLDKSGVLHIEQGKGKKDRIVPVPDDTMTLLRNYYNRYHPKVYLFNGQGSLQYDVRSIQQVFYRAVRLAGIRKRVRVHSLRHSRATHLLDRGLDIFFIQKLLGHSNIKTTATFYLRASIGNLKRHVEMVDSTSRPVKIPHYISIHNDLHQPPRRTLHQGEH